MKWMMLYLTVLGPLHNSAGLLESVELVLNKEYSTKSECITVSSIINGVNAYPVSIVSGISLKKRIATCIELSSKNQNLVIAYNNGNTNPLRTELEIEKTIGNYFSLFSQ